MGKYMRRKCGGGGAAGGSMAAPAGARTRSRAATAVVVSGATPAKRRRQAATTTAARAVDEALSGHDQGGGCYLHLRSRRLFMPAVAPRADEPSTARLANSGASGEAVAVVGFSRCSSAASSTVDMAARERSGGEAENSPSSRDVESSVSDSERRGGRERRESTPSSRPPVDCSDLESSQAMEEQQRKRRRSPATTTTTLRLQSRVQSRAMMPAAAEIEEFFAAAEKAQAERFAAKYNFDVALGVPLNAGRFEWTPVATV